MTASAGRPSAKILTFPNRMSAAAQVRANELSLAAELAALGASIASIDSGWYHADAVKADVPPKKQ